MIVLFARKTRLNFQKKGLFFGSKRGNTKNRNAQPVLTNGYRTEWKLSWNSRRSQSSLLADRKWTSAEEQTNAIGRSLSSHKNPVNQPKRQIRNAPTSNRFNTTNFDRLHTKF